MIIGLAVEKQKNMKNSLGVGLMGVILLVSGCSSPPPTVAEHPGFIDKTTLDDSDPRARLVLGSKKLVGKIRMANLQFRKAGLFTQAQVGIQNLSKDRYNVEYRIEWEDAGGFMVDKSGVWHRMSLAPAQINTIMATGKVAEAEHIVVNLRVPDSPIVIDEPAPEKETEPMKEENL